ncbi:MAG TPA: response regulator transcription factor [Polyangiaceae bacterium]|nr:response regulator transcription factor [Polyangiaceae bacterium]
MSGAPETRRRIVIAEDDPAIAAMLEKVLSQQYNVSVAHDGRTALALAAKPPLPALLMLDIMMPILDGLAVAAEVRKSPELKGIPIIFLTAKSGAADVIKGIQSGARHYITKPFKIDDVLAKVKKALGG